MSAPVVTGGAGSIAVELDALRLAAHRLDLAAADCDRLASFAGSLPVRLAAETAPLVVSFVLGDALTELVWRLRGRGAALRGCATAVRWAAERYDAVDHGVLGGLLDDLGDAAVAGLVGLSTLAGTHSPSLAAQAALTGEPELTADLSDAVLFTGLEPWLAPAYPDGEPVVHDLGLDRTEFVPPRSLTDLVRQLETRDRGADGEISVALLVGADGVRRAVVDIPGTKSWSPGPTPDVTSLSTNARALDGQSTAYERGVLDAMTRAGVGPHDPVLLVGHSEGGMVALTAARDAVAAGRFDVTHVVTAGSPVARTAASVPSTVQVLALENRHDVVPQLDGAPNPLRANLTTVQFDHSTGTIGGNHALDTYAVGAAEADTDDNVSVRAFLAGADGFLTGRHEVTRVFRVTRRY